MAANQPVEMSTQKLTKASLRRLMGERVRSLSNQEKRRQSSLVAARLWQHSKYQAARRISLYLSTTNEIDTMDILRRALEVDQKRCFIPYIRQTPEIPSGSAKEPRMSMVEIKTMSQYEGLPLNRFGIREPNKDFEISGNFSEAKPGDLDLMLVPGVAFSSDGHRLGHGKGFYDEFLAHWKGSCKSPLYTLGLAFKEQMVAETLAQEEHDYILDEVLVAKD